MSHWVDDVLIYIDEPQHVSSAAQSSHICVPFSENLDNLLARLDNRRMKHGSRNGTLE
jgi:hypothetical protein